MLSIEPERLIVGERNLVIIVVCASVVIVWLGLMKFGLYWPIVSGVGIAFCLGGLALIYRAWKADPWLSRVYDRYRVFPTFIPSHSSIAVSPELRRVYRTRNHFKR